MDVTIINDSLPDQSAEVPEQALPHYRRSGWYQPGEDPPGRDELAAAREQPVGMYPENTVMVDAFNPGTGGRARVAAISMDHYRRGGWVTQDEWDEQQPKAEEKPAKDDKDDGDSAASTPARNGGASSQKAGQGSSSGATDKES